MFSIIQKQLNKNTMMYALDKKALNKKIFRIDTTLPDGRFWSTGFDIKFKTLVFYKTNVCENCDDIDGVKYMDEAEACLCFNCRELVGLEIMADEQWEETKRSLMGVI